MKIMQIIYYPGQGGAEQYAYLLAKYAINDGNKVCFVFGQDGPLVEKVKNLGCEVFFIKMRLAVDPIAINSLSGLFKTWRPDIVHTHFMRENFIAIAANKLTPVKAIFSTVHRIEPKTKIQAAFNKTYSKGLTKFIAVSEIAKEYLINEGINEHRIVVIPNGAEIKKFDKNRIRKEIGIDKTTKLISCVARFTEEKGHGCLIDAFSKIKDKKAKLVLVGSGELFEKMKTRVKNKKLDKRVIFTGGRDKGYEVIGISDITVQPSKIETFSITTLEAMLQRIPIIASDIPAFKRLLGQNLGLLFKKGNSNDLAEKLDFALTNEKTMNKMAQKAYSYAKDRYTTEIMWQKTNKLYHRYLGK